MGDPAVVLEDLQSTPLDSELFFKRIPTLQTFEEVTNSGNHHLLPEDWFVIVTDVVGSTKAIKDGRYKDVNALGGSVVVSILNIDRNIPIPYVYGGDGATLAIPPKMRDKAIAALLATQALAREGFDLEIRAGVIPVRDLKEFGASLGVAKWKMSRFITQAAYSGDGWQIAEKLLKNPASRAKYEVRPTPGITPFADYTGFECRWRKVPARNGHQLALIVLAQSDDGAERTKIYKSVISKIEEVYGSVANFHPLTIDRMRLSKKVGDLRTESKIKTARTGFHKTLSKNIQLWLLNFVGTYLFKRDEKTQAKPWGNYRQELIENADFRKFDGTLRMIIDGDDKQGLQIYNFLKEQRLKGLLNYGMHKSKTATVTCIVLSHEENHTHFVDGSDGGYAIAASRLKEQLLRSQK